jgi:hypothetical protein
VLVHGAMRVRMSFPTLLLFPLLFLPQHLLLLLLFLLRVPDSIHVPVDRRHFPVFLLQKSRIEKRKAKRKFTEAAKTRKTRRDETNQTRRATTTK